MYIRFGRFCLLAITGVAIMIVAGCGGGDGRAANTIPTQKGVRVTASIVGLANQLLRSTNITPSAYKLALVNFWLIRDDHTEVNIINPDPEHPVYTEENPFIVSFDADNRMSELMSTVPAGTYTGYKMQFLYMEMRYPAVFHIPNTSNETDYPNAASIVDIEAARNFRLYFNAIGKYWKRDFVVELEDNSNEWYWMRRAIEDQSDPKNFFISVANNEHPAGGPGFLSTIDLFSNPAFWGDEAEYSSNANPIVIGTDSAGGDVDARLDQPFTIPQVLDTLYTINVQLDVTDTLNFWEDAAPPAGVSFTPNVLDLGPSYNAQSYGDVGLHPFLPRFNVTVTTGNSNDNQDPVVKGI